MNTEYPACAKIAEAIAAFPIETAQNGSLVECIPYGNGHINDTFLLRCETTDKIEKKFQKSAATDGKHSACHTVPAHNDPLTRRQSGQRDVECPADKRRCRLFLGQQSELLAGFPVYRTLCMS